MSSLALASAVFVVYMLSCTAGFIVNVNDTMDAPSQPRNGSADIRSLVQMLEAQLIHMNESFRRLEIAYTIQIANLTNELHKLEGQVQTGSGLGFSVYGPYNPPANPVKFLQTHYNYNDAYNLATGEFVCTKRGLYYFQLTLIRQAAVTSTDQRSYCYLFKNNAYVQYFYIDSSFTYPQATGSILLDLSTGDRIYITGCSNIAALNYYSHFSGFFVNTG